jgi:hypothetical protein
LKFTIPSHAKWYDIKIELSAFDVEVIYVRKFALTTLKPTNYVLYTK